MTVPQLNLVVLYVADRERAARFYGCLGLTFTIHQHGRRPEHHACEDGPVVFELYAATEDKPPSPIRIGFIIEDVTATIERLRGIGATIVSEPKVSPWGLRAVVVDFDGNRVELVRP